MLFHLIFFRFFKCLFDVHTKRMEGKTRRIFNSVINLKYFCWFMNQLLRSALAGWRESRTLLEQRQRGASGDQSRSDTQSQENKTVQNSPEIILLFYQIIKMKNEMLNFDTWCRFFFISQEVIENILIQMICTLLIRP